ncbi:MAG TPA: hypothetical protein VF017_15540 [Thermoanaerobaculia bacterium]|nr:hypothetical protein [Thermoanaerobaculia bacterium]
MPERTVDAKLRVTREGDAQAFKEVAEDVRGLEAPASQAQGSLRELASSLGDFDSSGVEEVRGAVERLLRSVERYEQAVSPDEQRARLANVRQAWIDVGDAADRAGTLGGQALADWKAGLDQITAAQRNIGQGLDDHFERARNAVKSFGQAAETSLDGVEKEAGQARLALNQLLEITQRLRSGGGNLTDAQVADLRQLEDAYRRAILRAGELRRAQQQAATDIRTATSAVGGQVPVINSLADVTQILAGKNQALALGLGGLFASIPFGIQVFSDLRRGLNEISGGGFDRWVQGLLTPLTNLIDGVDTSTQSFQGNQAVLERQKQLFESLNIPLSRFTNDVARNRDIIRESKLAFDQWAESNEFSKKTLEDLTTQLHTFFDVFVERNPQLQQADIAKILGPQIQEILDQYARLKIEVPPTFALLAEHMGIVTTEQQKVLDGVKDLSDKWAQEITQAGERARFSLQNQTKALVDALKKVDLPKLELVDPAAVQRARKLVQDLVDDYRKAGQQIPTELVKVADGVGVVVNAMERAHGTITVFNGAQAAAGLTSQQLTRTLDEQGNAVTVISTKNQQAAESTQLVTRRVDELGNASFTVTERLRAQGDASEQAGQGAAQAGRDLGQGTRALEDQRTAAEGAAAGTGTLVEQIMALVERAPKAGESVKAIADGAGQVPEKVNPAVEALTRLSSAVETLALRATPLGQLVDMLDRVRQAADGANASVDALEGKEAA